MQKHAFGKNLPSSYTPIPFLEGSASYTDPTPSNLPTGDIRSLHFHDCAELGICLKGSGIFLFGDRCEALQAGDALYVPPAWRHYSQTISQEPCTFAFIYLRPELLEECLQMKGVSFASLLQTHTRPMVFRPSESSAQTETVARLLQSAREGTDLLTALRFAELLLESQGDRDASDEFSHKHTDDPASLAAEYMALHYRERVDCHTLAAVCHLSESQLRRRFTALYREPPHAYLNRLRCSIAAQMLRYTSRSVENVSEAVGYASASELYRHFKALYHASPSEWRKSKKDQ